MTVEYLLLLTLFVIFLMSAIIRGPMKAFENGGPLLGARVEKHLTTGSGFLKLEKEQRKGSVSWSSYDD